MLTHRKRAKTMLSGRGGQEKQKQSKLGKIKADGYIIRYRKILKRLIYNHKPYK